MGYVKLFRAVGIYKVYNIAIQDYLSFFYGLTLAYMSLYLNWFGCSNPSNRV